MIAESITTEQFLDQRIELPDAGQWAELHAGEIVLLEPPDDDYGNIVLNLSKQFADYIQQLRFGDACFDLGLKLQQRPDTVLFPCLSFYRCEELFTKTDLVYTDEIPQLVFEIHSTRDRRNQAEIRRKLYFDAGVQMLCVIDPKQKMLTACHSPTDHQQVPHTQVWQHSELLPDFQLEVGSLFVEPVWWTQ